MLKIKEYRPSSRTITSTKHIFDADILYGPICVSPVSNLSESKISTTSSETILFSSEDDVDLGICACCPYNIAYRSPFIFEDGAYSLNKNHVDISKIVKVGIKTRNAIARNMLIIPAVGREIFLLKLDHNSKFLLTDERGNKLLHDFILYDMNLWYRGLLPL